jgi:hypothetical protein
VRDILGHASPETNNKNYATHHLRGAFDRFSLTPEAVASGTGRLPNR